MKAILLFILTLTLQSKAFAFPTDLNSYQLFSIPELTANYDFEGIVGLSNCSGSIVKFEGMSDDDPAYVLTNGHCVQPSFIPANKIVYKQPTRRNFTVLAPDAKSIGSIASTELVYGTMTGTDMALYRVKETYGQIFAKYNTRPLMMDNQKPRVNEDIEILSGYWRKGYSCSISAFIPKLREDRWMFTDSIRYSPQGCKVIGGTSGSPITRAGTKTVVGVNNTVNDGGRTCSMNNPCEIDENGNASATPGAGYGQQTYNIYTCLTETFDIDLNKSGCSLFKE